MTGDRILQAPQADVIRVRATNASDIPTIHALLLGLAETLGETRSMSACETDLAREGFGENPKFWVLLAERGDRPVGLTLFFHAYSSWRGSLGIYVQDLHVIASMRGTGLGRRLLSAAARAGRQAGCTHMRLSVAVTNTIGREFYQRIGLIERGDEMICQISDDKFVSLAESTADSSPSVSNLD